MKRLCATLLCALLLTGCASGGSPAEVTTIPASPTQRVSQSAETTALSEANTEAATAPSAETEPPVTVTPASEWTAPPPRSVAGVSEASLPLPPGTSAKPLVPSAAATKTTATPTVKTSTTAAAAATKTAASSTAAPTTVTTTTSTTTTTTTAATANTSAGSGEIRAIWLSYYELTQPKGGVSKSAFQAEYDALFKSVKAFGINVLFLHLRAYSDAFYPSKDAPWSAYLTGTQGKDPGYDPLAILCQLAQTYGISVHAWLNPFRITEGESYAGLAANHPARAHIQAKDGWVGLAGGAWYWNPAVTETHAQVYNAAKELLAAYPIDGIHLDDYFYPTTAAAFDASQYAAYTAAGGKLSLADWRRGSINAFVSGLYRTVKNIDSKIIVSISPTGNISRNRGELYADTSLWMRETGYTDWMIPQIYFGFQHPTLPFEPVAREWAALPRHSGLTLMVGLAFYKTGKDDKYAGAARGEWQNNNDLIARQLRCTRGIAGYQGFALYATEAIFGSNLTDIARQERTNLQKLLS